jgi:hypothetical protein
MSKSKHDKSRLPWESELQDSNTIQTVPTHHDIQLAARSAGTTAEPADTITTAALIAPLALSPQVVQIIDTTTWPNPSPDPSGMAFIPGAGPGQGTLLMSDSEIDETPFFRPDNLFYMSATGTFDHSASLEAFTKEATGIVFDSQNGHVFISDDSKKKVFEIDPNNPGTAVSSFSTSGFALDSEDIAYDPATNHLFVINGGGGGSNARKIFETTTSGTVVASMLLPSAISDPEAIAYDPAKQVFYISGTFSPDIFVVSRDGQTILDTISILEDFRNPISDTRVRPKGLVLAPSSDPNDDPSVMSLWAADYGKDQFMDGRIFEIQLAVTATQPPLFTSGSDIVDFNTVTAGDYQQGTQYDALAGNDTVTLPADAAAAIVAGYDPVQTFHGRDGNDVVIGGGLDDLINGEGGTDKLTGADGDDRLDGASGNDTLDGGAGNDTLLGGSSSDTLIGGLGDDLIDGGTGNDLLDFSAAAAGVTVDLVLGTATGEGNDTLLNIENVTGSAFDDVIGGSDGKNLILGGAGNDVLHGAGGNDTLTGEAGLDQLFGDAGNDTLKWDSADKIDGGDGFDTIDAKLSSADTIDLRGLDFANVERIQTGSGKDNVTLSLNDVLSDTADNQFIADLGSSSPDTLTIDTSGGWTATTPDHTLGPTGTAAGASISGMTAYTFTNGIDTVTVFSNAEVVNQQLLS